MNEIVRAIDQRRPRTHSPTAAMRYATANTAAAIGMTNDEVADTPRNSPKPGGGKGVFTRLIGSMSPGRY